MSRRVDYRLIGCRESVLVKTERDGPNVMRTVLVINRFVDLHKN